jgi:flagellar basal-body rod protein FlgB
MPALSNSLLHNLAKKKVQVADVRQKLFSENIANVNTPRYLPKDVNQPNFKSLVEKKTGLTTTNPRHFAGLGFSSSLTTIQKPDGDIVKLDGNGVILDEQLFKAAENARDYRASTALYQKINALTLTAINK